MQGMTDFKCLLSIESRESFLKYQDVQRTYWVKTTLFPHIHLPCNPRFHSWATLLPLKKDKVGLEWDK